MTYRFVIDTTIVGDPSNWDALELSIKRDSETNGITVVQTATLEFHADGYTYIKNKYDTEGWNKRLTLTIYEEIEGDYRVYWNGLIFLSDVTFDLKRGLAKVKIQDDSYYAMIDNNKSIGISIAASQSELSKNNSIIDTTTFEEVDFFSPETGVYDVDNVWCISVHEMLSYMIAWMSDGRMSFRSDCFNSGGEHAGSYLTTGASIANNNTVINLQNFAQKITFTELMESLSTLFSIGWIIEVDGGQPVFRVEPKDYFYNSTTVATLNDIDLIEQSTAVERLYSKINIGSSDTLEDITYTFPEGIALNGFSTEEYVLQSVTNVDNALDLTYNLITSSNVIEAIIGNTANYADDSYDNGWVIVDVDIDTMECVKSNWLGLSTGEYYNEKFTNNNIITRSLGGIPNDIVNFLTSNTALFKASKNADQTISTTGSATHEPIPFQNDSSGGNSDNGNHWDATTDYDYTADISGLYTFRITLRIDDTLINVGNTRDVTFKIYDEQGLSGGNLIDSFTHSTVVSLGINVTTIEQTCFMLAGYRMIIALETFSAFVFEFDVMTDSSIECIASSNGSGIVETVTAADFNALVYTFTTAITKAQQLSLIGAPNKLIRFDDGKNFLRGFIEDAKTNNLTGKTNFKLTYAQKNNLPKQTISCPVELYNQILFGLNVGLVTVTIGMDAGTQYYVYIDVTTEYSGISDGSPLVIPFNAAGTTSGCYVNANAGVKTFEISSAGTNALDITNATELESVITPNGAALTTLDISQNPLLDYIDMSGQGIYDTEINSILIQLDNNGLSNGEAYLQFQTPSAPPFGAGATAAASLISKGWTVITD